MAKRKTRSDKLAIPEAQIPQIQRLAGLGLSIKEICQVLGMSSHSFERRRKENKELAEAVEKGKSLAKASVAETAYDMAVGGKVPVMTIFWLKTQAGWREPIELTFQKQFGTTDLTQVGGHDLINMAVKALAKKGYKLTKEVGKAIDVTSEEKEDKEDASDKRND